MNVLYAAEYELDSLLHVVQTQHWGPPSLLSNGYQDSFPRSKVAGA
jgi:hypothetical protein